MADAAAPAPTQPAGAEDTIRVRVRQQEPAGEHDLSLPIELRRSALLRDFFNNALMLAVLKTSILEASQEMNLQIIKEKQSVPKYLQG